MNNEICDDQLKGLYLEISGVILKLTDSNIMRYDTTIQGIVSSNPSLNEVVDYLNELDIVHPKLAILSQSAAVQCAILKEFLEGMALEMKSEIELRNRGNIGNE